jgi:ribosomal protein S18 acetylase RimI-like enzyme
MDTVVLRPMAAADIGGVLDVQRAAFTIEAQLYDDPRLPPLREEADAVLADLGTGFGYVAVMDGELVGSIRVHLEGRSLHIARLAVAPAAQGRGIGTALLALAETAADADEALLFTGHLSVGNLRLYERAGYREQHRRPVSDLVTLVYLRKPLAPAGR